MKSETYYVLSTWSSPRDFWEWFWEAAATSSCHCFTFLPSTVDFNSLSIGLCQSTGDTTFMQRSVSISEGCYSSAKQWKPTQIAPKEQCLKHLLETWDTMGLQMEKYKTLKGFPLKWMWQTVKLVGTMKNKQTANFWLLELFLNIPPKHLPKAKLTKKCFPFKIYYKVTENRSL